MKIKEAVIEVLQQAGTALHHEDIAKRMMAAGLWQSEGATPGATIGARIYSDIKDNGERSPFVKVAPRIFALRDSAQSVNSAESIPATSKATPTPSPTKAHLSLADCIQRVLEEFGGKKPMHYKEITEKALQQGWLVTSSRMPESGVRSGVGAEIWRKRNRGEQPHFVRHGKGYVGLSQWLESEKVDPGTTTPRDPVQPVNRAESIPAASKATPTPPPTKAGLSFTDCAQKVLEEFGDKKPMHYKEITEKALQQGWLVTSGRTPESSMHARVIFEIKRNQKRGEQPRFVQHGRGYVGLSQWMGRGLSFEIEQHNQRIRKALRERLLTMTPGEFEELVSQLLAAMGFEVVEVTKISGDGGIDVRGDLVIGDVVRIKMAVQAKRWKLGNNVQAPIVQQVRGSLGVHEQGLIITTSDFSPGATKEASQANKTPIALMNGKQLVALLMEHDIGVHRSTPDLFEIDEEFGPEME